MRVQRVGSTSCRRWLRLAPEEEEDVDIIIRGSREDAPAPPRDVEDVVAVVVARRRAGASAARRDIMVGYKLS